MLAVDREHTGRGLGGFLFVYALDLCCRSAHADGASLVVLDALTDKNAAYYAGFGFRPLPDRPKRLVMPVVSIEEILSKLA
jgi:predicted N-acetyltransferase YhbS